MKTNELREKSNEALDAVVGELREDLFRKKMKHRTGQLPNTTELRATRKNIARALTIQSERKTK